MENVLRMHGEMNSVCVKMEEYHPIVYFLHHVKVLTVVMDTALLFQEYQNIILYVNVLTASSQQK